MMAVADLFPVPSVETAYYHIKEISRYGFESHQEHQIRWCSGSMSL